MSSSQTVGVYSTSSSHEAALCQQLGAIKINSTDSPISELRHQLMSGDGLLLGLPDSFAFVTPKGWEIGESLESTEKISSLIGEDSILRLHVKHSPERLGLFYEGAPIGYICVDVSKTRSLRDVRGAISIQHPSIYSSLNSHQVQFLDVNGWPVSSQQERNLHIIDVLKSNAIHLASPFNVKLAVQPLTSITPGEEAVEKSLSVHPKSPLLNLKSAGSKSPSLNRKSFTMPLEIVISYVHKESMTHAKLLSKELNKLGYSVFLDKHCIKPGDDWQDTLNDAVCNCNLFIPLVTSLYGLTEWTNKEIKLADTLSKYIIPVNFLPTWPPMCLAIQFATTQFIRWTTPTNGSQLDMNALISKVAAEVSDQYKEMQAAIAQEDEEEIKKKKEADPEKSKSNSLTRSLPSMIRKNLMPQADKSMIVISYHPAQLEFVQGLRNQLESRGYEMWASMAGDDLQKREVFKKKVNTASLVVFVLSQEYVKSQSCEQEMYYCEGRKRLLPILVNSFQIPGWMSTLVGSESFINSQSDNFQSLFMEEVEYTTVPAKAEVRLRKLVQQKTQLHRLCKDLKGNLPKGTLVYVTGSTKFGSKNGKEICEEFGRLLANQIDCYLVTGGFYGVGETIGRSFYEERQRLGQPDGVIHIQAVKDAQDYSTQARQNTDGTFEALSYGKTLFYCDSVRQRETLTPKVIELCILIEGGPAAAFETHQFSWSGFTVVPVPVTGGAANGKFNVPPGIFFKPDPVSESDWLMLSDENAQPKEVATALVNIVNSLKPLSE